MEWLIIGLGNPGAKYGGTRHNVGRDAVLHLATGHAMAMSTLKHNARFATGRVAGQQVALAVTTVYMNESGRPTGALARFWGLPAERVLVVYDDMDLPLGTLRLRHGGGTGGHNGLKSITAHLGTPDFPRLRMGIERPPPSWDATGWVLGRFAADEQAHADAMIAEAGPVMEDVLRDGLQMAMNLHNKRS